LYISEDVINSIKQKINIVDVIGEYVKLKQTGQNYKGLCPFHSEKTPSFIVSPQKGIFHCFGCGAGGNVFNFLMNFKNISFPDAVKLLGDRLGIQVRTGDIIADKSSWRSETLYKINEAACNFFKKTLFSEGGRRALNYLINRHIKKEIIEVFSLGYAPDSWDSLIKHLNQMGFGSEILEEAGLVVKKKKGSGYYDRFRDRITFPIFDNVNKCVGFGGRALSNSNSDKDIPKYVNTSESQIFHKGRLLYGFSLAEQFIKKEDRVFIVEGYIDVIRMYQEGIRNCVAPLGTALTEEQISLLSRFTRNIYLTFDPDEAGKKAALRSISLIHKMGIDPFVINLPSKTDPGDFFDRYSIRDFFLLIEDATPGVDFIINYYINKKKEYTANEKIVILNELSGQFENMENEIIKTAFLKQTAQALKLEEYIVTRELNKLIQKHSYPSKSPSAKKSERGISLELKLLILLMGNPGLFPIVKNRLEQSYFLGKWTRKLWNAINRASVLNNWDSGTVFDYLEDERFIKYLSSKLLDESLQMNPKEQLIDMLVKLKEKRLKDHMNRITTQLQKAELENDQNQIQELMMEKQSYRNEIEKLRLLRENKIRL